MLSQLVASETAIMQHWFPIPDKHSHHDNPEQRYYK